MATITFPERLDRVEDELAGLDSALDSRTRILWAEVSKLKAELAEMKERLNQAQAAPRR